MQQINPRQPHQSYALLDCPSCNSPANLMVDIPCSVLPRLPSPNPPAVPLRSTHRITISFTTVTVYSVPKSQAAFFFTDLTDSQTCASSFTTAYFFCSAFKSCKASRSNCSRVSSSLITWVISLYPFLSARSVDRLTNTGISSFSDGSITTQHL